ncbi:MAG: hypothetical protein C0600_07020 [Ignavibacteria bacterium]|nr:MAG: hypothetical protein C0600_07020 [Ignavibacteria bacterium]
MVLFLLLAIGFAGGLSADEGEKDVALVTAVNGKVVLLQPEGETPLSLGMRLRAGDEIRVDQGSAAVVFLTGEYLALESGERLTLGETLDQSMLSDGSATRGVGPDESMNVAADGVDAGPDDEMWQTQLASVSGIRADVTVIAVSPRLAVSDPLPTFFWYDADGVSTGGVKQYTLLLRDAEGKTILRERVSGYGGALNSYRPGTMPAGFNAAERWHYTWTVVPDGQADPQGTLDAGFVYVDNAGLELAALQRKRYAALRESGSLDASSYHMLLARYFLDERERLFSDAVLHLVALAGEPAGEEYARGELARMFLRFGNQVSTIAPKMIDATVKLGTP